MGRVNGDKWWDFRNNTRQPSGRGAEPVEGTARTSQGLQKAHWGPGRKGLLHLRWQRVFAGKQRLAEEWKFITEANSQLGVQGWGLASWFCLLFTAQIGTVTCSVSSMYSFARPHLLWGERRKPPNPKNRGTGWGKRYWQGQTGFRKMKPILLLFS